MSTRLSAARLLQPGGHWGGPATLTLVDGRIAGIEPGTVAGAEVLEGGVLTAGMLDLHNNGAFGVDFAEASTADWRTILARLAAHGVTSVQPTIITAPIPALIAALERIGSAMPAQAGAPLARVLGVHLEGPFLAPARRGAHRADWIADPTADRLDALLDHPAVRRLLRMVTLAPEQPGGLAAVRRLADAGIAVALGHSDATAAQATAAAEAGATAVTHVFNAMRPFAHRDPGLSGVALTDPRLRPCVIVDGQHVDAVAARLVFAAAGARTVAVTDSIALAGLPPGASCCFGGARATLGPDGLGRRDDGTIAGAGIVLDEGIRRMIRAGIDPAAVLHAATQAPADLVGRPDLGRLAVGALADLVWWDEAWVPRRVWVGGMEVAVDR